MKHPFAGKLGSLRTRTATLFVAGLLVTAGGFHVVLVTLTRHWLMAELDSQSQAMARRLAGEVTVPLVAGDLSMLQAVVGRVARESDVIGAAVYRTDGTEVARAIVDAPAWAGFEGRVASDGTGAGLRRWSRRLGGIEAHDLVVPVTWRHETRGSARGKGKAPRDAAPAAPKPIETVGWVRLAVSTARPESAVAAASRGGLLIILLAVILGTLGSSLLVRAVVRPLREASDLARAIAAGNLRRRLPVKSADELGTLALSMNTMAVALDEAQQRERAESAALRDTVEAIVAVAQSARASQDPTTVFRTVATQLRRVTGCTGIALIVPDGETGNFRFEELDPQPFWGGIDKGTLLDPENAGRYSAKEQPLVRLALLAPTDELAKRLSRSGLRSAMLVPLALESGPPALLLLTSASADDFPPSQVRVVVGLTSHLSSALHSAQLRNRLELAFQELQDTQQQLVRSERLRATGDLASGVAHDFNNVLGAILGRAQLVRRAVKESRLSTSELLDSLAVIELAARDGAETVRRLRQFSKGDALTGTGPVDLEDALRAAADFTRPRWRDEAESEGRRVELSFECQSGIRVQGRASELREVFTNLILNAVDALPGGGTIRLATRAQDGFATAVIEDDGIGMTPEVQQRVFDPFFSTKGGRGTGLGLSVVHGIVDRLGGHLAVTSRPGHGTQVELVLPLAAEEAPLPASAPIEGLPASTADVSAATEVMIVDDEPAVRELLVDIVLALGHRPTSFASADEAMRGYQLGRYRLILSDLGMPGMTGWEFAQAIRKIDPEVTIAFVTGWSEDVALEAVLAAGVDAVVAKPFAIEDVARITQLAARGRIRDAAA